MTDGEVARAENKITQTDIVNNKMLTSFSTYLDQSGLPVSLPSEPTYDEESAWVDEVSHSVRASPSLTLLLFSEGRLDSVFTRQTNNKASYTRMPNGGRRKGKGVSSPFPDDLMELLLVACDQFVLRVMASKANTPSVMRVCDWAALGSVPSLEWSRGVLSRLPLFNHFEDCISRCHERTSVVTAPVVSNKRVHGSTKPR